MAVRSWKEHARSLFALTMACAAPAADARAAEAKRWVPENAWGKITMTLPGFPDGWEGAYSGEVSTCYAGRIHGAVFFALSLRTGYFRDKLGFTLQDFYDSVPSLSDKFSDDDKRHNAATFSFDVGGVSTHKVSSWEVDIASFDLPLADFAEPFQRSSSLSFSTSSGYAVTLPLAGSRVAVERLRQCQRDHTDAIAAIRASGHDGRRNVRATFSRNEDGGWVERQNGEEKTHATFLELKNTDKTVQLFDRGRDLYLSFDLPGRRLFFKYGAQSPWNPFYVIDAITRNQSPDDE